MKIISWNVNGLRSVLNKGFLDFFNKKDADIFCIQETKMQKEQADFDFPGYYEYWNCAQKKGYSGTLILTKNMTENDNGIVCNTAEIAETYNEYGQEDIDSIPENNKEGEDDISSANVILGLKTGGPIVYITLTITIMALISIGAYEINKRVLKI